MYKGESFNQELQHEIDPHMVVDHTGHDHTPTDWLYIFLRNPFAIFVSIIIVIGFIAGVISKLDKIAEHETRLNDLSIKLQQLQTDITVLKFKTGNLTGE